MKPNLRGLAAGLAVGLLLALLVGSAPHWQVEAQAVWQRTQGLASWQLAALVLALTSAHVCRGMRLYLEWQARVGVAWWECLRVVSMHYGLLNVLPMRAGEAGFSWLLWQRWKVAPSASVASLLLWRLQDGWLLFCLSLLVCLPVSPTACGLVGSLLLVLTGIGVRRQPVLAAWLRARPWCGLSGGVARAVGDALASRGSGWGAWMCGAGTWASKLAAQAAMLIWLTPLALQPSLSGALAGEWGAALPLQPAAGFGTYELAVWLGVDTHAPGASAAAVLAAALTAHLISAMYSIFLGTLFWLGSLLNPPDVPASI